MPENRIIPVDKTPSWVIKKKYPIGLDEYYTDSDIAKQCMGIVEKVAKKVKLPMKNYTFIEPSAGSGAFYDILPPDKIGMDLVSRRDDILSMNFFDFKPSEQKKYIAIGNPPFGARAWMALAFINHCATFCDMVGFILPMYFASDGKGSAKNRVKGMDLVSSTELPANIFTKPDGSVVGINTVFQVWTKKGIAKDRYINDLPIDKIKEYIEVYTVCTAPARRCGLAKIDVCDYFLQSTYYNPPKVVTDFDSVKYGSGYGIIIKEGKRRVSKMLQAIDWDKYALRATNHCKHLGMYSIYRGLYDMGILQ